MNHRKGIRECRKRIYDRILSQPYRGGREELGIRGRYVLNGRWWGWEGCDCVFFLAF